MSEVIHKNGVDGGVLEFKSDEGAGAFEVTFVDSGKLIRLVLGEEMVGNLTEEDKLLVQYCLAGTMQLVVELIGDGRLDKIFDRNYTSAMIGLLRANSDLV